MNKKKLVEKIVGRLHEELEVYRRAAHAAHIEATHEQSKAENKYDTRGLEASYLARGQSRQAADIEAAIAAFEKLDARPFKPGQGIDVGALVELDHEGERTFYFVGPCAGGTEVNHGEQEVLVITPQSPLGAQLQGKKEGDQLQLHLPGTSHKYRVMKVM